MPLNRTFVATVSASIAGVALFGLGSRSLAQDDATATPGKNWTVIGGGATRTGVADAVVTTPLSLLWQYTAGHQFGDPCAPIVVGDTVFFAARGDDPSMTTSGPGALYAVDVKTGSQKWRYNLTKTDVFRTAPTFDSGVVYIGASDGSVYAINATTGSEIVHYHTGRPINSAPLVLNNVLYFGSDDGKFYALDPQTGASVWRRQYNAGDAINSEPVVSDDLIYVTTAGNDVQAIRLATGLSRWQQRIPYRVLANGPVFADNTLFVPAGPRMYGLQASSGATRWVREAPSDVLTAPVCADGILYFISREAAGNGARIFAVHTNNGKDAWSKPVTIPIAPSAAPTISGKLMYIPTVRDMIFAISLDDGKVQWEYRVTPSATRAGKTIADHVSVTTPLSVANGALYALTDDGTLSAFRTDAPDKTGPSVYGEYPGAGERVNGAPPLILASYANDPGSGIDPSSITMDLDDKSVAATYDPYSNLISYSTRSTGKIIDQPLANGRHSATVTVKDWRGNETKQTWSFIVDSTVPQYTKTSPPPSSKRGNGTNNGRGGPGGKGGFGGGGGFGNGAPPQGGR